MKLNVEIADNINENQDIELDFASVKNIALNDIQRISDIHKLALINGKKLYIKNATKEVMNLLEVTGLSKSFYNFETVNTAPTKRQRRF